MCCFPCCLSSTSRSATTSPRHNGETNLPLWRHSWRHASWETRWHTRWHTRHPGRETWWRSSICHRSRCHSTHRSRHSRTQTHPSSSGHTCSWSRCESFRFANNRGRSFHLNRDDRFTTENDETQGSFLLHGRRWFVGFGLFRLQVSDVRHALPVKYNRCHM